MSNELGSVFDSVVNPQPETLGDIFESALKKLSVPLTAPAEIVQKQAQAINTPDNPQAQQGFTDPLAFERSAAYPNANYTDPTVSDAWNVDAGAGLARKGLETGLVGIGEAVQNAAAKDVGTELPSLGRGAVDTSAVDLKTGATLGDVFDAATGKMPVEDIQKPLSEVFDETVKPSQEEVNLAQAKRGREFLSPEMQTPEGVGEQGMGHDELAPLRTPVKSDLPVIDPKSVPEDKPFALYRGSGFGGDFYDVYNSKLNSASNQQLTLSGDEGLQKIKDAGIPLLGKTVGAKDSNPSWLEKTLSSKSGSATIGSEAPKTPEALTDRLLAESKTNVTAGNAANEAKQTFLENRSADTYQNELFIRNLPEMSKNEQEALQFSISGNKVPKSLVGTEVGKLIENPTPAMQQAGQSLAKHYDELHQALVKRYNGQVGYRENYGPMFLDQGTAPKPLSFGGSELSTRNPNIQAAKFPDLASAMNQGYARVNKSALDDLRSYHKYFIESENALDLKDSLNGVKDSKGLIVGPRHLMNNDAVRIEHPAFQHTFENGKGGTTTIPLYARPDVYKAIKILLEKPFKSNIFDGLQALNGVMKKSKLSLSLFHHFTLTENALTSGVLKNVLNPNDWINALSQLGDSVQKGGAAFIDPKWSEIGLRNGLTLGNVVGAEEGALKSLRDQLNKVMKSIYPDAPEVNFGDLEKGEAAWDALLWKHVQPFFKLSAFKNNALVALEKFPNLPSKLVLRQVASQVNAEFGGAVWENVFENPNTKKLANFVTLALDWNYSNFKVLANSLSGGMNIERMNPFKENFTWGANTPNSYLGRQYLVKSLLLFAAGTEALNYANTKIQNGKGKFTWQNDEGQKMGVFLFRAKGKNYYLTLNKGLRDSFLIAHVLYDLAKNNPLPFKQVIAKMAPIMHLMFEQMTGKSMTGYDMHFENPLNRYLDIAKAFLPMVTSGNSFAGALPVSSGMSQTRFKEEFKYAYAKNDYPKMTALIKSAAVNSVHWKKSVDEIRNEAKQEKRYSYNPQPGINSLLLQKMGLGDVPNQAARAAGIPTGFTLAQIIGDALQKALKGNDSAK